VEQVVYGDLLFLVNFCMDFQCLFLTAKLLHRPFPLGRALFACALGAFYACAALFLPFSGLAAFALDLLVCLAMCGIVFLGQEERKWRFLIPFSLYFGVSALVGGMMSGAATLLSRLDVEVGAGGSSISFLLLAGAAGVCTFLWGRLCQRRASGKSARLRLVFSGRELQVSAFVDTAHQLCDPVGGRPVVILDLRTARELLPCALIHVCECGTSALNELSCELVRRVRVIPARTVTGTGMLLAVRPDAAYLDTGKGAHEVELLLAPVPLAALPEGHKALLPPALWNE
jgi:sigma-E processing peptidase SpoIIGA